MKRDTKKKEKKKKPVPELTAPDLAAPDLTADVLIVGGGLVGGTLAAALSAEGLSAVVVDVEAPEAAAAAKADGRVSAIALSSKRLLDSIGVWRHLAAAAAPILDIRVTEGHTPFFLHYDSQEVGGEPFGYMVENRVMRQGIAKRIAGDRNIVLLASARVRTLSREADFVLAEIETADGPRRVRAALAVGADGRGSRTRRDAGIGVTKRGYNQTAIVCAVRHERSHDFVAHELFQPAGPFAILPMNDYGGKRSAIVWSERPAAAPLMAALDDDDFSAEIQKRAGDFLGAIR
ncbi:MAG: 2-octaprenyl-6-methoxyphenyl hydroxylase, partial [Alphaproteobacteria bacterium]|nr:2-octaprenyl-6-methoxyphenyl hydroxylase [Alphaproteobacteria bacterium]